MAISAALAVVEPYASGLGGGAFWLLSRGEERPLCLRRCARSGARRRDPRHVPGRARASRGQAPRSTGRWPPAFRASRPDSCISPGATGACRWPGVLAPAIRYAEEGVESRAAWSWVSGSAAALLATRPAFAALYLPGGKALVAGDIVRQPDLARTLRQTCRRRTRRLLPGRVAPAAGGRCAGRRRNLDAGRPGRLRSGRARADPDAATRRDHRVGAAAIVGRHRPGQHAEHPRRLRPGRASAVDRKHLPIEAMRRAYRDRAIYLGDPAFVSMPLERLLSPVLRGRSARIDPARPGHAQHPNCPGILPEADGGTNTTHFSVLDRAGNRVAGDAHHQHLVRRRPSFRRAPA